MELASDSAAAPLNHRHHLRQRYNVLAIRQFLFAKELGRTTPGNLEATEKAVRILPGSFLPTWWTAASGHLKHPSVPSGIAVANRAKSNPYSPFLTDDIKRFIKRGRVCYQGWHSARTLFGNSPTRYSSNSKLGLAEAFRHQSARTQVFFDATSVSAKKLDRCSPQLRTSARMAPRL